MRQLDKYHILIDNNPISHFSFIEISQPMDWHHTFDIRVPISVVKEDFQYWLGKLLRVVLEENYSGKKVENEFNGLITSIGTGKTTSEDTELIIRAQSPTILLDNRVYCRSFTQKTLQQIVIEVLKDYDIVKDIKPKTSEPLSYCVQYTESDFQFLRRLAAQFGEWFFFNGQTLFFGQRPETTESKLTLGSNVFNLNLYLKIEPLKQRVLAYNYTNSERFDVTSAVIGLSPENRYSKTAMEASESLLSQESRLSTYSNPCDKTELEKLVANRKEARVNDLVKLTGASDLADVEIGKIIRIEAASEQDGKYLVVSATHSLNGRGEYEMYFEAIPVDIQTPPEIQGVHIPQCETQIATIVENDDPDELGRVRVRFLWQSPREMSPWIRIINFFSGPGRGTYFIPEKGDEVFIGFEKNHPEAPYVIGSIYNGKGKPNEWKDADNNKKAIKSRSGNQILFSDKPGKEEISIFNKDKINLMCLSLENNGVITIKSNNELNLEAKTISLNADTEIKIKSSGKLEMDGGSSAKIKAGIININ